MQATVGSSARRNARQQKIERKQADEWFPIAVAAYRQGRHADAQALCRRILQDIPDYFHGLHLLGVSALDCARIEEARRALERAIAVDPRSAEAHSNLGFAYFKLRRYDEARRVQERALALNPNFPVAQTNLGNTLMRLGLHEEAIAAHERAIRMKPDYADAHCNRGTTELMLNRFERAVQSFDQALSFQPRHLEAIIGKGLACVELQHFEQAETLLSAALAVKPDLAQVLAYRGRVHFQFARYAEAEADFDAALALSPELEVAWRWKAQAAMLSGNQAKAIHACKRLLDQNPRSGIGLTLLGASLTLQGEIAAAIAHFDRALEMAPDYEDAITKKIFALDFLPATDFAMQQAARKYWWDAIGAKLVARKPASPSLDPDRRLVVGYVSSDFRGHSVAFCVLPVLRRHDHAKFEVICYSCSLLQDAFTDVFRSHADRWVDASRLSDDELADRIEADGVDILVDLSGHTAGNRLSVFARKPAPIQVTAWGSGSATGLPTIDYFFADPIAIPVAARPLFAEKVHDLPAVITMEPITELTPAPPPMLRNGYVTFGVFNRIDKISDQALKLWSALMRAVPGSRIIVKNGALDDQLLRDALAARFKAHGIAEGHAIFIGASPRSEHLRAFDQVDISLDPFPQNGGISTWESLYMGVPVVAKLGNSASSRVAGALLEAIGLRDWIAGDDDGYIAIARQFASMPSHLQKLRAELPSMIARSAAGNVEVYTRKVEEGYRQFWRDYCAKIAGSGDLQSATLSNPSS
jgi:predicted O-linked N-acetylglucosamine transferase (SPINDLY family)